MDQEFILALREAAAVTMPEVLAKSDVWHPLRRRDRKGNWQNTLRGHLHSVVHNHCEVKDHGNSYEMADIISCVEKAYGLLTIKFVETEDEVDSKPFGDRASFACSVMENLSQQQESEPLLHQQT